MKNVFKRSDKAKVTAELLKESYRQLAEHLPAITYIVELLPTPHTVYISPQVHSLLGFTQKEWLADPEFWIQQLAPEDRDRILEEVRRHNETAEPFTLEYRVRTRDGWTLWLHNSATYQTDETGKPIAVHGVMQDITARKRAEVRLRELTNCLLGFGSDTEANINALVATCGEAMGAACALYNRMEAGRLCSLGQWHAPPGFQATDQPEGHICSDVINRAGDQPLVIRNLPLTRYAQTDRNVLAYGLQTYVGVAVKYRHQAVGSLCVVYQHDLVPPPEKLDFMRLVAFAIAIEEERKQAEQEIRKSEERFRKLFEDNSAVKLIIDPDTGKILSANKAAASFYGWSIEQLKKMRIQEINTLPPEAVQAEMERATSLGSMVFHFHHRKADGSIREVEVFSSKMAVEGKTVLYSIIQDITERQQAEKQLRESEARNRALINAIPDLIFTNRRDGEYLTVQAVNPSLLTEPLETVLHRRVDEVLPKPVANQCLKAIADALDSGTTQELRYSLPVDGHEKNFEARVTPLTADTVLTIVRDITDRKRTEDELKSSHELLSLFIRHSPVYAYIKEVSPVESRVLEASENFQDMIGLPGSKMRGRTMAELFPPEMAAKITADDWAVVSKGEVLQVDEELNGRQYTTIKFPIVQGGRTLLAGYTLDITDRKQAEAALRERESNYFDLFNTVKQAIYIQKPDSTFINVNQGAVDMYGYARAEFIGQTPKFLAAPGKNDFAQISRILDLAFQGQPQKFEFWGKRKDGSIFPKDVWTVKGKYFGQDVLISLSNDITERKQAEDRLRESEKRLAEAQGVAHLGSYVLDLPSGLWESSDVLNRVFGLDRQVRHPQALWESLLHPDDRGRMMDYFRNEVLGQGLRFDKEYRIIRQDDRAERWVHGMGRLEFDANRNPVRMIGTIQDITDRKLAEAEKAALEVDLFQAQKMESVGRLAGGVAHDFNNILQAIMGNVELALEQTKPDQTIHHDLLEVQNASRRAADLIRQLLAFARKQTVTPRPIDLNQNVENMLKMLRRLIGEEIKLVWSPAPDLWPVRMDPSQTDQILANLCVNARDATGSGGEVQIETKNVQVDELHASRHEGFVPGDYVLLLVSDTGCGMGKETQDRIFEPFYTTKDMGKGTGLGLSTVYGIVRQNHGHIAVYSEQGQGTTFRVYLPRHMETGEAPSVAVPAKPAARGSETLLLVEDEPAILKLTTRIIEQQGYTVLPANTPGEAIRLAQEHPGKIHLLLTDIVMPGMNGRELSERLKAIHPHLKCMFMSGYTANVIARQGMLETGVHFIQKPFSMADLDAKIRTVLDGD